MRALKAVLVAALFSPALAFGWGAHLTDNASCATVDDAWITWPEGIGTIYASGVFGGATLTWKWQTLGGAAVTIDPLLVYTSTMSTQKRLDFGSGQKVCAELTNASGTTAVDLEIHPFQTRKADGKLQLRY